ncbi:ribose-phosphate pyrophosphokinase, partial [Bacillus sp. SIMBA_161]
TRVIALVLPAPQIPGFFVILIATLLAVPILTHYFEQKILNDIVVVSPGHGGVTRVRKMADRLKARSESIDKRRPKANVAEGMNIIGN